MSPTSSDSAPRAFARIRRVIVPGAALLMGCALLAHGLASRVAGGPLRLARIGELKLAALQGPLPVPRPIPSTADSFADHIGVVVHLVYADSGYANWPQVEVALRYLGVRRLREMAPLATNARIEHVHAAADAGCKFDFLIMGDVSLAQSVAALSDFSRRHPGSIAAIEGPNEVNNFPVTYGGSKGDFAAQAFQADLFKAVKANPALRGIPVYNLTSWPDLAGRADFGNLHSYSHAGAQAKATLLKGIAQQQAVMPGKPMVLTEAGYHNAIGAGLWEGVDEATAAPLTLNMLFDAWSAGISDIYIYQLLDAYADPEGKDMERHFGLFDTNYRPKPAATALRNLLLALRSRGVAGPALASARIGEGPADLTTMQLLRADGSRIVIIYRHATLWDPQADAALAVAAEPVTVLPPGSAGSVTVDDPVTGSRRTQPVSAAALTLLLGSNPLVLAFSR